MDQIEIAIYARTTFSYCWRTKRLFRSKAYAFEAIDVTSFHQKAKASTR
jgi:glutaredoxin